MNRKALFLLMALPGLALSMATFVMVALRYPYLPETLYHAGYSDDTLSRWQLWLYPAIALVLSVVPIIVALFPRLARLNSGISFKTWRSKSIPIMPRYALPFHLSLSLLILAVVAMLCVEALALMSPMSGWMWAVYARGIAYVILLATALATTVITIFNSKEYKRSQHDIA